MMREEDERYFEAIESRLNEAFEVASCARKRRADPEPFVEIPLAQDMADRVENLLAISGLADRIRDLETRMSREEAALELARDFAAGRVGDLDSPAEKIEGAVRTAVALLTEGVVAAPIEGIDRVELRPTDEGSEYVRIFYAGPIRSAGGTAQALSVLVADYTRTLLDIDAYSPRSDEIERYVEEVDLYDTDTGLQYSPSNAETRFIAANCPIMLDGEATGDVEVSGYRDLDRIDTNKTRGGMCLVLAEGIALKAPKIKRYTTQLPEVDWPWLDDLIQGTVTDLDGDDEADGEHADTSRPSSDERILPEPSGKYLRDLIAGRPVFSHPSRVGGFRLRYGRARNHGFATAGIHPATMHLLDDFLATGTQIKTERPGKAAGVVPVDSIDGPTVRLTNGKVCKIDDPAVAIDRRAEVDEILDVGEYLVNFGEFIENNHPLVPASYVFEWWIQEFQLTDADVQALRDDPHCDLHTPDPETAITWSTTYGVPLHPRFTYLWHDITVDQFEALAAAIDEAELHKGTLVIHHSNAIRTILEKLLIEHHQQPESNRIPEPRGLLRSMGYSIEDGRPTREWSQLPASVQDWPNAMLAVNEVAPFTVRERAPTRIGNRMGRPEKSERRELNPAVHTLFPLGEAGGDQRDVMAACRHSDDMRDQPGELAVELGRRVCPGCGTRSHQFRCPSCHERTELEFVCPDCEMTLESNGVRPSCPRCERDGSGIETWTIDLGAEVQSALEDVNERAGSFDKLKGVKRLMSATKAPEPLEKGILRAKHDVSMFKDGTIRYDMTDLPVTAVRPEELDVTVDHFRDLGYDTDIAGEELIHDDQLVGLKVQDIVLSDGAAEHLLRTANFVDDLLDRYYDLDPFYGMDDRDDLVGELVFGMAPHTSAAVVGRVVGFTNASVGYAHPYFHAAKRRNCDGDEDCVMLLMDGLLNFSKSYLPEKRGGSMDSPLVMSSRIDPAEIDDEAHNMDIVDRYPLEFYEATLKMADPGSIDIQTAESTVGTDAEYAPFNHTHDSSNIALGPELSAYKTLGTMMEKMDAQLALARKLRAVDETDVAERVIEFHFLPDLIGNLRAFSSQESRCHGCGTKYRRMPLSGRCNNCRGNLTLTVHRGSVNKYLDVAVRIAEEFDCREYTKQRLYLLENRLESIFENDKNKQSGIADFM